MTESTATALDAADLAARVTALRSPLTHDEMAGVVARRGSLFTMEAWLVKTRYWLGSIIGVGVLSPLLYFMALGVGLGVVVDRASGNAIGMPYLHFVAPALLLSTVMQAASEENTFAIMGGFKWDRVYYGPLVTPITPEQIATGHVLGVSSRYLATSTIYLAVLGICGAFPSWGALWLLPIGVLLGSAVGLPIMWWSATITEDKGQFALLNRFVLMPMMLFAGTYFPLESLPVYLQPLGWASPLWHAVALGRVATVGATEPIWLSLAHVAFLAVLAVVGYCLAVRQFRKRLAQ